ncbi:WYL domain-containing protein [Chryseolinea sp. H1M3-3]|uniref:helix-turn-helix transcriptional regulator n=1 Tax=Chryseolinea sp. H1M3-3 TaxID=3034144 RepID=UPI0023EAC562|nr:WYL domain-containing protein [Chryseolinea sp. H1M3-3]
MRKKRVIRKKVGASKKKIIGKKTESIIPQAKLLRLFQIIAVLKSGHWTIKQLADRFDTSDRTIYRYINLLEEVDFLLEKDFENRFFIITTEDDPTQAQFSIEETKLIKKLIQAGAQDNPLKSSLLKKLSLNSEMDSMPRLFLKARLGHFVDKLAESILNKNQIVLKNYHSANSNEIRDRLVEPIHFGDNYQSIIALDTQDKICKQFKLDRIGEIIEMGSKVQFENLHQKNQTDIFGFTGDSNTWITLHLSLRAYLLLREEYPLSIPYIERTENGYTFHGPVSNLEGIGRFVLGLMDEIQIKGPDLFKTFIENKFQRQSLNQKN